jgi:hypothetical protein
MLGIVETISLLEKEVITPKLGRSTHMLLIYGQSFSSSKNDPGWEILFQFRKWFDMSNEHKFSNLENGPDRIVIFVMKML